LLPLQFHSHLKTTELVTTGFRDLTKFSSLRRRSGAGRDRARCFFGSPLHGRSRFTFLGARFTSRGRSGLPPFSHALTIIEATAVIESFRRRSKIGRTCPKNWSK